MKGFKKLALVAAIAAPISSVHALEAIDDAMLSDMTGQSGVTIDLETQVTIGQVKWTDEGSVNLNNISVGGFASQLTSARTFELAQTKAESTIRYRIYNATLAANGGDTAAAALAARTATTVDHDGDPATAEVPIAAAAQGSVIAATGAADEAGALAVIDGAISATGVTDTATKLDNVRLVIDSQENGDLDILVVTQSGFDAEGNYLELADGGVAVPVDLGVNVGSVGLESKDGNTTSQIASNINMDILLGPQKFTVKNDGSNGLIEAQGYFQLADTSSLDLDVVGVSVTGLRVGNFAGDNAISGQAGAVDFTGSFASSELNDYTQVGFAYYNVGIGTNASNQLVLDVNNFNADIQMDVNIGGASIGQITMTDFDVSGTKLTVYGHN